MSMMNNTTATHYAAPPNLAESARLLNELARQPALQAARRINKPLVLYGAGNLGRMAVELLEYLDCLPEMIVDAQAGRYARDTFWQDRNLVTPAGVPARVKASHLLAVSIATLPFHELAAALTNEGWRDVVPFYDVAEAYRDEYPLSNGWVLDRIDADDLTEIRQVMECWGDDISRAHHLQFIAWHRLRKDWVFQGAPVTIDDRYFIPEVHDCLRARTTFLDVGAHHGEVTRRYIAEYPEFERIWMIEPDPHNLEKIRRWTALLKPAPAGRIGLIPCAVGAETGRRPFFGGLGYVSQLSGLGGDMMDVATIDALRLDPSYIKLHLEGAELEALKGATETLRRARPALALTVYHNDLGVWETPRWLMRRLGEMGLTYRFLFRLHSWCGTGAVLYALPECKG